MAKIIFVLVFAIAVAMPLRTVLGQGGWQDLMGQGDLTETLDEAKKAIGAASTAAAGQAAFDDYFGGGGDLGGAADSAADAAADGVPADASSASLADWIDENATSAETGAPPLPVDSPIGQPEDLPAPTPQGSETDDVDSFAPGQSPGYEFRAPSNAFKVIPEAPEDDGSDIDGRKTPGSIPIESPTDAPDGAPSDDDEDADSPYGAPSFAPQGVSGLDFDDNI
ncbi:unnamed protein product [Vicia faba]|uniref:Uncharacterized protein n=1 Tax=Vicia faba TaxID=3906 RepID=A0AAV0YCS2_VICFA|nr:unnamed protein product [Vicia faba]